MENLQQTLMSFIIHTLMKNLKKGFSGSIGGGGFSVGYGKLKVD